MGDRMHLLVPFELIRIIDLLLWFYYTWKSTCVANYDATA